MPMEEKFNVQRHDGSLEEFVKENDLVSMDQVFQNALGTKEKSNFFENKTLRIGNHDVPLDIDSIDTDLMSRPYILNAFFRMHFGYPCQHSTDFLPGMRWLKRFGLGDTRIKVDFKNHSESVLREYESKDGHWATTKFDLMDLASPIVPDKTLGDVVAAYFIKLGFPAPFWGTLGSVEHSENFIKALVRNWKATDRGYDVILSEYFRMHFGWPFKHSPDICPGSRFLMQLGFSKDLRIRIRFQRKYNNGDPIIIVGLEGLLQRERERAGQWIAEDLDINEIESPLIPRLTLEKAIALYFARLGFPEPFWRIEGSSDVRHFYNAVIENWISNSNYG